LIREDGSELALDIKRPTLLIDRERALRNLERMAARVARFGLRFRPHFKTHQSPAIGNWFRDFGVRRIAVSSVTMARLFASEGWDDITIAFPVNLREIDELRPLAEKVRLGLLVDSVEVADAVDRGLSSAADAWIKVDAGYGRAGADWNDERALLDLAGRIGSSRRLRLSGILSHNGLTYLERSVEGVKRAHADALSKLLSAKRLLREAGFPQCDLSIGDTPSASIAEEFGGADEIRPGNFIFYDVMQAEIGSCTVEDVAVAVACPVVGVYPRRGSAVVYGGAAHLSAQSMTGSEGIRSYGEARTQWPGWGRTEGFVSAVSQEHGVVRGEYAWLESLSPGGTVFVVPVHSCLTCDLHGSYTTLEGDTLQRLRID
jgi:D-serine deaminase-like pyridoxal phosphate-dependent protein